jgi:cell division ATPase FtsA
MNENKNTKREYYLKILEEHKQVLSKSRNIIDQLLNKVQLEINSNIEAENFDNLFGSKESLVNVTVKLAGILLKIIPLEIEIAKTDMQELSDEELAKLAEDSELSEDDMKIIDMFVERYNQDKEAEKNLDDG